MTRITTGFYCHLLLLCYCGTTYGQTISNVRVRPLNNSSIEILYDLAGSKPDDSVFIQVDTRKESLYVPAKYLTGDIGRNVTAGEDRRIVWNTLQNSYGLMEKVRVRVYLTVAPVMPARLPEAIADTTATSSISAIPSAAPKSTAFVEPFTSNRNNWLVGQRNGYQFDIANGGYTIRKQDASRTTPALCYIMLPNDINLNKAESFTITVDMISSPGEPIDAGLAIGIRDIENYAQFRISKQTLIIKVLANGTTFASYMPGTPIPLNKPLSAGRNAIMIEKRADKLYFYLNGNEVPTSPYDFRTFRGNGVGFLTGSPIVTFQNLKINVGENP